MAGPGFSMKLKAVADKDPSPKYPLNKNVRQLDNFNLKHGGGLNLMFQPFKGQESSKFSFLFKDMGLDHPFCINRGQTLHILEVFHVL